MKVFDNIGLMSVWDPAVFVGYDPSEDTAAKVLVHSIRKHASDSIPIYPLIRDYFKAYGIFDKVDDFASTQFSMTRFLVPYLMGFNGTAIFVDCDMLFTEDIFKLLSHHNREQAVQVVKHEYIPKTDEKMGGLKQTTYAKKNWSSVMVWNCSHPKNKILTPSFIEQQKPGFLHKFEWLDDNLVGSLPKKWNFLVEEYEKPDKVPGNIHYTLGGPWFEDRIDCDYSQLWLNELTEMQKNG